MGVSEERTEERGRAGEDPSAEYRPNTRARGTRSTRRTARDPHASNTASFFFGQREEVRRSHHDHPNSVLYMWQGYRKQMGGIFGTSAGRVHRGRRLGRSRSQEVLLSPD